MQPTSSEHAEPTPFAGHRGRGDVRDGPRPVRTYLSVDLRPDGGTPPSGATGSKLGQATALGACQPTAGDGEDRNRRPAPLSDKAAARPRPPATQITRPGEVTSAAAPAIVMLMPCPATIPADTRPKAWPRRSAGRACMNAALAGTL